METLAHTLITALANRLDTLEHGGKRAEVERVAEQLDWSPNRVYNALKKVGWSSGRKRRADAGQTSVTDQVLLDVATVLRASTRANGKVLMSVPNATSVLVTNGREIPVSNEHLGRLLRQRNMHAAALKQPSPAVSLKSLHPNHVHQVDPSYCVLYYLPKKSGKGESFIQKIAGDDEFYKNKPQNFEKAAAHRVWRYVLTDHYSGAIIVRYYQAAGESVENLYDFLLYCWSRKAGRPFHGVPRILMWDKGSANTSSAMSFALQALDVEDIAHAAGKARVKGQVENGNNLVERHFESLLRLEPVSSVDQLNAAAERWYIAYNANVIPRLDTRLHREGMAQPIERFGLWQTIRQEQLRILPEDSLCRWLLHGKPEQRKVSQKMTITYSHPQAKKSFAYDLRGLPEVFPGAKVEVAPLVYGDNQVRVTVRDYKDDAQTFTLSPVLFDDLSGFRVDAPVIGEAFDRHADTALDANQKAADRNAYPDASTDEEVQKRKKANAAPFGGLVAHSHLADVAMPAYMNRPGTALDVPGAVKIEEKPLSHIEAMKRLRAGMDRALTSDENAMIREQYPNGVPADELDRLLQAIVNPEPMRVRLSLVN
jgi:transposase InsO family protein